MKTKKKRSTGLLALLLAFLFVLSACGNTRQAGNSSEAQSMGDTTEAETNSTETVEEPKETVEPSGTSGAGRLKMTLNGTDVVYAELTDTPATAEFLGQLPFMSTMHEHLDRQKELKVTVELNK